MKIKLTPAIARNILNAYKEAWIKQDTKKLLSIFNKNGIYHEYLLKEPYVGHKAISDYWERKVVQEQSNITFKLLDFYISDDTLIAEWDASFDSNIKNARYHIIEAAIMKIKNGKVQSLREYWHPETVTKR